MWPLNRKECWHVVWLIRLGSKTMIGDTTYTLTNTRLTEQTVGDLRKQIADDNECEPTNVNILSLTKIPIK